MTVLSHPNLPSFEGAAPNLAGLEVLVKWSDGKEDRVGKGHDDYNKFTVDPPVVYVGNATNALEWFNQYTVYYRFDADENIYNDPGYGVKVYLPVTIPLAGANRSLKIKGKLGEVFEDVGINSANAGGITVDGNYVAFIFGAVYGFKIDYTIAAFPDAETGPGGPTTAPPSIPRDYGYTWEQLIGFDYSDVLKIVNDTTITGANATEIGQKKLKKLKGFLNDNCLWPSDFGLDDDDAPTKIAPADDGDKGKGLPVAADPKAWRLNKREEDQNSKVYSLQSKATYFASLIRGSTYPADTPYIAVDDVEMTKWYRVDRLDFKGFNKTMRIVPADDKDLGGNNIARRMQRLTDGTPVMRTRIGDVSDDTRINWMWVLWKAEAQFEVIYYDDAEGPSDGSSGTGPKRPITMADYIRAVYTVDEDGTPRAALPIFTGYNPTQLDLKDNTYTNGGLPTPRARSIGPTRTPTTTCT